MHENSMNGAPSGVMVGFLLGAVVGAGVALLMAPAAGTDTRRRIGDTARRLGHDAATKIDEVKGTIADVKGTIAHRASELKGDLKDAVQSGRDAARSI